MRPLIGIAANCSARPDSLIQELDDDYVKAIEQAGGTPVMLPVTERPEYLYPLIERLDGLLLTGGSDVDPSYYGEQPSDKLGAVNAVRDAHEFAVVKKVLQDTDMPILAICRGCQLLNVAGGGKLYQDLPSERPDSDRHGYAHASPKHVAVHTVFLLQGSRLMDIYGEDAIPVNSFHHQAVKETGPDFSVSAVAQDGIIEGIERNGDRFVVGVQWHPEMMHRHDDRSAGLFRAFVDECRG
ncbi:gamma-glutamyl-gamma-aminobutyrate hydrolase family protein [Paenibacillus marinisediminis]